MRVLLRAEVSLVGAYAMVCICMEVSLVGAWGRCMQVSGGGACKCPLPRVRPVRYVCGLCALGLGSIRLCTGNMNVSGKPVVGVYDCALGWP